MTRFVLASILMCAAAVCRAQTLQDELQKAGIPTSSFTNDELVQGVNAASARNGDSVYFTYMRVDANNAFSGSPEAVRYETVSGKVVHTEFAIRNERICCGSPLGISFTRNYALFEFHLSPSAGAVIVADSQLKPVAVLYGFGVHEVAPDEVIFTENMVHFAPAHPERIVFADLRTGAAREIYPPKGDALRTTFARDHEAKMPPQEVCAKMNDPCSPDDYDEGVEVSSGDGPDRLTMLVSRDASHGLREGELPDTVLSAKALYVYERRKEGWFYCEAQATKATEAKATCNPKLPVESEKAADPSSYVKRVN